MCYNLNINFVYRGFDFTEQIISIDRMENAVALFGSFDENIKLIEKEFTVKVVIIGLHMDKTYCNGHSKFTREDERRFCYKFNQVGGEI